ncbi:hypothetical protein [Bradyrhizobium sp. JR3.5]
MIENIVPTVTLISMFERVDRYGGFAFGIIEIQLGAPFAAKAAV